MTVSEEYLVSLREQLEFTFDKKIEHHNDCISLQDHILLSVEKRIAISSIRRLFKQVKYEGGFSYQTLKILEEYIHYHQAKKDNGEYAYSGKWLLEVLENAPTRKINDAFLVQFIRSFYAIQLSKHHALDPLFLKDVAESKLGRRIFYDQFLHLDGLKDNYGLGISYYLDFETVPEHRAFAICLLGLREYLYGTMKKAHHFYNMLPKWDDHFHPFIQGRIRGLGILLGYIQSDSTEFQTMVESDINRHAIVNKNYRGFPAYELMILETLWRIRDYNAGLWLTQKTLEKWSTSWQMKTGMDEGYYQVLKRLMLNFSLGYKTTFQKVAKLKVSDVMPKLAEKFYAELLA